MVAITIFINPMVMLETIIQRIEEWAENEELDGRKSEILQRSWGTLKKLTSASYLCMVWAQGWAQSFWRERRVWKEDLTVGNEWEDSWAAEGPQLRLLRERCQETIWPLLTFPSESGLLWSMRESRLNFHLGLGMGEHPEEQEQGNRH